MATSREESKLNWNGDRSDVSINRGSLQRIADACENMAANWTALTDERNRYKRWYEEGKATNAKLENRIRSLRGAVTKAKRAVSGGTA